MSDSLRLCDCGSGELSWWMNDGRGIPLCRVCDQCQVVKMSKFNPVILGYYTQADVDEQIEPED